MTEATRKAAVLLRSLDADSAAVLLAQLSPAEARVVRDAVRALGDVTDEERLGVASELAGSDSSATGPAEVAVADEQGVELALSPVAAMEPAPTAEAVMPVPAPIAPSSRLLAAAPQIEHADPATLASYLQRENPRVVAVVLSHLPAERAAAVLDELHFDQRAEAIERLLDLGEGDDEALEVLAADLGAWISHQQQEQTRKADRLATIGAILDAAAPTSRSDLVNKLHQRGCEWAANLPQAAEPVEAPAPIAIAEPPLEATVEPTVEATHEPAPQQVVAPKPLSVPFAAIEQLNPKLLAEVVRRTPPRQTLLALAGASESLQQRVESLLGKKQARELRRRIDSLGPTSMRDIDAAQLAMAQIASDLWDFFHRRSA